MKWNPIYAHAVFRKNIHKTIWFDRAEWVRVCVHEYPWCFFIIFIHGVARCYFFFKTNYAGISSKNCYWIMPSYFSFFLFLYVFVFDCFWAHDKWYANKEERTNWRDGFGERFYKIAKESLIHPPYRMIVFQKKNIDFGRFYCCLFHWNWHTQKRRPVSIFYSCLISFKPLFFIISASKVFKSDYIICVSIKLQYCLIIILYGWMEFFSFS